ncbi:MAG: hypothetical protein WDN25_13630 [Acetobacteraceae bacterium]
MRKVSFFRLRFFVWVPLLLTLVFIVPGIGAPYVIWSYDFNAASMTARPRVYTRCTYAGIDGVITEYPDNGQCGWLRFGPRTGGF